MEKFRKYFLITSLVFSVNIKAKTIVISTYNDTIKQTNLKSPLPRLRNKIFAEVNSVLKDMSTYIDGTYIVSSNSPLLKNEMSNFLKKQKIKFNDLFLNDNVFSKTEFNHKYESIKRIMDETDADVILIGNDASVDPEVFKDIKKLFGNRVLSIYIHAIKMRPIDYPVVQYVSSFDLAYFEYQNKRYTFDMIMELSKKINKASMKNIIPSYAYCPKDSSYWKDYQNPVLIKIVKKLALKILDHCTKRTEKGRYGFNEFSF